MEIITTLLLAQGRDYKQTVDLMEQSLTCHISTVGLPPGLPGKYPVLKEVDGRLMLAARYSREQKSVWRFVGLGRYAYRTSFFARFIGGPAQMMQTQAIDVEVTFDRSMPSKANSVTDSHLPVRIKIRFPDPNQ